MNETKKPKGRPRVASSGLPQEGIKLTLDANTVDFFKSFGKGSVSNGVRIAAAFISDWRKTQ